MYNYIRFSFCNYKYMGIIDDVYKIEPQNSLLWDLKFTDPDNLKNDFHMRIADCTIPFYKLVVEQKLTGEKVYKAIQDVESATFTIREDINFNTYKFFQLWFNDIYDLDNRVFKTATPGREKLFYRDLQVIFYRPNIVALDIPFTSISTFGFQSIDLFKPLFPMKPSYQFNLRSCRLVGLSDLSLNYDGGPVSYSIEVAPQRIDFVKSTI